MFSYVGLWFAIISALTALTVTVVYSFKYTQYHTTRTLLAIVGFIGLALAGLLVFFAQPYLLLPTGINSRLSSMIAILFLTSFIFQIGVVYPQLKKQGRRFSLVPLAIFAIIAAVYAFYSIYTVVTSIIH